MGNSMLRRVIRIVLHASLILCCIYIFSTMVSLAVPHVSDLAPLRFDLHDLPFASSNHGVTVISGFFLLKTGKKHSVDDYWRWIEIFLTSVELPIVMYTSPDLVERMREMRGSKPITFMSTFEAAEDMPPIVELGGHAWAHDMNAIDPEQYKHVEGVYATWTAKPWMVLTAAQENVYRSEYFVWVDAGGFREESSHHHMTHLAERLDYIYHHVAPRDSILLGNANWPWPGPDGLNYVKWATDDGVMDRTDCHIQGGFFGGPRPALEWWYDETLRVTKLQTGLERFAGKEQDVWTHTARLNWSRTLVMKNFEQNGQCGSDSWFAYLYWADNLHCEIPIWNGPWLYKQDRLAAAAKQKHEGKQGTETHDTVS